MYQLELLILLNEHLLAFERDKRKAQRDFTSYSMATVADFQISHCLGTKLFVPLLHF